MENCIIQSKGLIPHFWVEAINYANYIVNFTLTKALKSITPKEAWREIKPNLSYPCVFGSESWADKLDEKRKTLQPIHFCWIF
jgi:hypothetical protein